LPCQEVHQRHFQPGSLGFPCARQDEEHGKLAFAKEPAELGDLRLSKSSGIKLAILFSEIKKSGFVGKIGYPKVDGLSSSSPLKLHLGYTHFQTHPFEARLGQGLKQALDREAIISVELCSRCRASTCLQTSVGKWVM
jgi:hypothetical protein